MAGLQSMPPSPARRREAREQFAPKPNGAAPAGFREGGGEKGRYHDSFVLKFTPDGKFLGEIGKANGSKGSLAPVNLKGVAQDPLHPPDQRGWSRRTAGGNHRVSIWDGDPEMFKGRMWGAYGKAAHRPDPIPHYEC